ncbi:serine hydrolase [Streptomyces sp. INA 01156]
MIQSSDNDSAGALWQRIGGGPGLTDANKTLGLTSTQAGPGVHWGLTRTTAADQLTLLNAVFADTSPLSTSSRQLIRTFMGHIDADQDWGVSAEGSRWQLKNGWLQRSHSKRWVINSMGRVEAHGSTFYVVVLSHGSPSMSHGISTVERAARTAVHALYSTAPPAPRSSTDLFPPTRGHIHRPSRGCGNSRGLPRYGERRAPGTAAGSAGLPPPGHGRRRRRGIEGALCR